MNFYGENKQNVRTVSKVINKIFEKNLPILNIGDRMGVTGYLDFIKGEEITSPVMKGRDIYGRKFFVIKVIINNIICMQTFFQRYNDIVELWMGASVGGYNSLLETVGGMKYCQVELLKDIIEGKKVKFKEAHRPNCSLSSSLGTLSNPVLNKNIILYDEKKWNAANTIKNCWEKSRYDPAYSMCRRIISEKLENIRSDYH